MDLINIKINGQVQAVSPDLTILQAAGQCQIEIPTLCAYKDMTPTANCRMCVVEVEGARNLLTACSTKVSEGMVIETHSDKVKISRKMTLELILSRHSVDCHHCARIGSSKIEDLDSRFCEMCFFCDCVREGFCELQTLAREYGVDKLPYEIESNRHEIDDSMDVLIRNPNKCIGCRRCVTMCGDIQTVHALSLHGRGSQLTVGASMGKKLSASTCVACGKCVDVCPTGAIFMKEKKDELLYYAHDLGTTTAAHISENIIEPLAELFKMPKSDLSVETIASGLKKIGINYVFSDTVTEKRSRLLASEAIKVNYEMTGGPLIVTSSYSGQKFVETFYPDYVDRLVTYPSSQALFSRMSKDGKNKLISITNSHDNQMAGLTQEGIDYVLNARELYRLFMRTGFNPKIAEKRPLDIMYPLDEDQSQALGQWLEEKDLKVMCVSTLGQARQEIEKIKKGINNFDVLRITS